MAASHKDEARRSAAKAARRSLWGLLMAGVAAGALGAAWPAGPATAQDQPVVGRVDRILVEGARRVDDATIKAYMTVQEGEPASAAEINASLRRLLDTGLFENVVISPMADGLLVRVEEAPFINIVEFEGNDALADDTLRAAVGATSRSAFSRAQADRDAQVILDLYRRAGRFGATVDPVIIERENNRVDLVFEIDEGQPTGIRAIDFVGNEAFSDRRLRGAVETRESGILSFLFGTGTYDPDRLEYDKEQLRRYYLDRGYADFRVLSATAELTADREDFLITFTVEEGETYTFGELGLDLNLPGIAAEDLQDVFVMEPGQTYSISDVDESIENLIFQLGQAGYAFIDVRPRADKNPETGVIDVTLEVGEGPRVYVERLDIQGNTRTVDRVLRREFRIAEGDAYNAREVEAARSRLRALGFFDRVDVRTERGSADDRAVVVVDVDERLTGSLSLGLGYSSADGPGGDISITERNFLGRGQFVQLRFNVTGDQKAVQFSFAEPHLLDRDLEVGFGLGYVALDRSDESSFEQTNISFRPYTEFPIAEQQRLRLRARFSDDEIRDVSPIASPAILEDEGSKFTTSVGAVWSLDERNDVYEPTQGYLLEFEQDLALSGGDTAYTQSVARAHTWRGFFDDEVVASIEAEAGAIFAFGDNLRVIDRFFLGGNSFRGFASGGIGPRDRRDFTYNGDPVRRDDALGGTYYGVVRSEVSFPLGLPEEFGIYGGLFADVGTLWGLKKTSYSDPVAGGTTTIDDQAQLRASIGASLFIDSPFGPLRFNLAMPLAFEEGDEKEYFRFTVGTRF